jgi:hypothetical protein
MKLLLCLIILSVALTSAPGQDENKIVTEYLFPEFSPGRILLKAGTIRQSKLNYNSNTEEMIFEFQGQYLAVANVESIDTVYIKNRKFIPVGKLFYEIPVTLKIPLLIRHTCRVIPPGTTTAFGGKSETSSVKEVDRLYGSGQTYNLKLPADYRVIPSTQFFILKEGSPARISNIKQLIKLFPAKEAEIKKFVKDHGTDFEKQEDLIDLIIFCNQ